MSDWTSRELIYHQCVCVCVLPVLATYWELKLTTSKDWQCVLVHSLSFLKRSSHLSSTGVPVLSESKLSNLSLVTQPIDTSPLKQISCYSCWLELSFQFTSHTNLTGKWCRISHNYGTTTQLLTGTCSVVWSSTESRRGSVGVVNCSGQPLSL